MASSELQKGVEYGGLNLAQPKTKAEEHFVNAFRLMKAELYQAAVVEFHQAVNLGKENVLPQAKHLYSTMVANGDIESALSVGMLILSIEASDHQLITSLAILARRVGNNNQGIALFKQAISLKPDYFLAVANLGAAMENLPLYDQEPVRAYNYFNQTQIVVPAYLNAQADGRYSFVPDYIKKLTPVVLKTLLDNQQRAKQIELEAAASDMNAGHALHFNEGKASQSPSANKTFPTTVDFLEYFKLQKLQDSAHEAMWEYNSLLLKLNEGLEKEKLASEIALLKEKEPQLPYINVALALAHAQQKNIGKAVEIFMEVLKADHYNRLANVNLGLLCRQNNKINLAAKYLILGYYLLQRTGGSYYIEEFVHTTDNKFEALIYKEARKGYQLLVGEGYAGADIFVKYITCLEKEGDIGAMLEAIEQGLAKFPQNEQIRLRLSEIFESLVAKGDLAAVEKKFGKALELYKIALKLDQRLVLLNKVLKTYEQFELSDDERVEYEKIKALVVEHLKNTRPEKSPQELARQASLDEQWSKNIQNGLTYVRQQNFHMALPFFEKAFMLKNNQEAFDLLSNTYRVLGRNTELTKVIEKFKKIQLFEKKIQAHEASKTQSSKID